MKELTLDEIKKQAVSEERKRQKEIMDSDEAKGRIKQAEYFCFKTYASSKDAILRLRLSPLDDAISTTLN